MLLNIKKGTVCVQTGQLKELIETFAAGGDNARAAYEKLAAKPSTSFNLLVSGVTLTKMQKDELAERAYKFVHRNYMGSGLTLINIEEILHYYPEASEDLKMRLEKMKVNYSRKLEKIRAQRRR